MALEITIFRGIGRGFHLRGVEDQAGTPHERPFPCWSSPDQWLDGRKQFPWHRQVTALIDTERERAKHDVGGRRQVRRTIAGGGESGDVSPETGGSAGRSSRVPELFPHQWILLLPAQAIHDDEPDVIVEPQELLTEGAQNTVELPVD